MTGASSCAAMSSRSRVPSPGGGAPRIRSPSTGPCAEWAGWPETCSRRPSQRLPPAVAPAEAFAVQESTVRILFNLEAALGQRTGVGHYTAELFRCLVARAAPDEVIGLPVRWRALHARLHTAIGRVAGPIRQ